MRGCSTNKKFNTRNTALYIHLVSAKLYGTTELETIAAKIDECYKIVRAVKEYGVNQQQILKLIELLALELENVEYMRKISTLANELANLSLTKIINIEE